MHDLAKSNVEMRMESRREDADLIRKAFWAPSQAQIARNARKVLGVSKRQVEYWLNMENDMPSWVVKAAKKHVSRVERIARRIEGDQP